MRGWGRRSENVIASLWGTKVIGKQNEKGGWRERKTEMNKE